MPTKTHINLSYLTILPEFFAYFRRIGMPLYSSSERNIVVSGDAPASTPSSSLHIKRTTSWAKQNHGTNASVTTPKMPFSKVVEGLTHSQGSIALIAALLAGFAFQALTTLTITYDELDNTKQVIYICFSITTCLTIASFLFVAVSCSMLEQSGLVARSLAISTLTDDNFDDAVKEVRVVYNELFYSTTCNLDYSTTYSARYTVVF
jgi:hypothetical protein